jgi:hypothetical protein
MTGGFRTMAVHCLVRCCLNRTEPQTLRSFTSGDVVGHTCGGERTEDPQRGLRRDLQLSGEGRGGQRRVTKQEIQRHRQPRPSVLISSGREAAASVWRSRIKVRAPNRAASATRCRNTIGHGAPSGASRAATSLCSRGSTSESPGAPSAGQPAQTGRGVTFPYSCDSANALFRSAASAAESSPVSSSLRRSALASSC